ncbi:NAD(P)-binding domain-containing protein [Alicyclobacillus cycloheptanicus]|uniref:L-gulonate 3-dehydrogenase n=1 Tax=Alicyclobacillus cycloheptanicus TaxID=1457 RepID=A0ABT9XFY5_9BACL|nr:3-hydroxyacyl-CoA dehydrogenase NAD-binding domain-containing protein [Alicyclobacillus cycloheptanicus]MDQ0189204.1 3-hydroxybutyryl-CoA dehydrogenase [Alicyclobacillus cycloheptanicus]WDM00389.1 NAD(P)-binding domain-containing protein [Alicyclobacillus cycloheptanicus]
MKRIAVIGGGTMGFGLAFRFAVHGREVALVSRRTSTLENALQQIREAAASFEAEGVISKQEAEDVRTRIHPTTDLAAGIENAAWVIEAIPEQLSQKQALFAELDAQLPAQTLLTTTTSSLPISDIANGVQHPERTMVTHFVNPPHLIPLVEIVQHPATLEENIEAVERELNDIHCTPVRLNKEAPGFIANRLQAALFREVLNLLQQGIASPEAIDTAVKQGLGFRWAVVGPIETADFGGLDTWAMAGAYLAPHLANTIPVDYIQAKFRAGELGVKTGKGFYSYEGVDTVALTARRDRQMLRLGKLKQEFT